MDTLNETYVTTMARFTINNTNDLIREPVLREGGK